jgi:hypothetical protein
MYLFAPFIFRLRVGVSVMGLGFSEKKAYCNLCNTKKLQSAYHIS